MLMATSEFEYHLILAHDLSFLGEPEFTELSLAVTDVKRMLTVLYRG